MGELLVLANSTRRFAYWATAAAVGRPRPPPMLMEALTSAMEELRTAAAMRSGLVERIPDPDGGMARKFRITDKGARLLDEERERTVDALEQFMADWSDEDIAAFASYLRRFNAGIERLGGRPWPRP